MSVNLYLGEKAWLRMPFNYKGRWGIRKYENSGIMGKPEQWKMIKSQVESIEVIIFHIKQSI